MFIDRRDFPSRTIFSGASLRSVVSEAAGSGENAWLRRMSERHWDFRQATDDTPVFAARAIGVDLKAEKHARLMVAYLKLSQPGCWIPAFEIPSWRACSTMS